MKEISLLKKVVIFLAIILVAEIIYFGIKIYHNRKVSTYYTVINSIILENKNTYVGAGFSDYKYSNFNKFDKGYEKATLFKVKNGKTVKEKGLLKGYNGRYNDIIETSDGYIAVGRISMTKEQVKEGMSEAVIAKYNKDFKLLWRKNLSILEKTEFKKVELDGDDIIVVGTSIYSDGYIGNHKTGGGILLKYDKDGKEKLRVNYGGPYSGSFNDLIVENDSYVVVGLGKANSGIIIKYDKKGNIIKSNSYGYTDKSGINAIIKVNNEYIVATTKVINTKDLSTYTAALVKFDKDLKLLDNTKYSNKNITYFNDLIVDNSQNIYACGYTGNVVDKTVATDAIIVKFNKDLVEQKEDLLKGNKNDFYSHIYLKSNKIYLLGYSNSKLKKYNINGYDYSTIVEEYKKLK